MESGTHKNINIEVHNRYVHTKFMYIGCRCIFSDTMTVTSRADSATKPNSRKAKRTIPKAESNIDAREQVGHV